MSWILEIEISFYKCLCKSWLQLICMVTAILLLVTSVSIDMLAFPLMLLSIFYGSQKKLLVWDSNLRLPEREVYKKTEVSVNAFRFNDDLCFLSDNGKLELLPYLSLWNWTQVRKSTLFKCIFLRYLKQISFLR